MSDQSTGRTRRERRGINRYMWEIGAGAAVYLVLFLFLPRVVNVSEGSAVSILVALAPLVPVLWIVVAVIRHLRRVDELQRTVIYQSFAAGFVAAMLIALTVALLGTAGIVLTYPEWWVFIGGMSMWALALAWLSRRVFR